MKIRKGTLPSGKKYVSTKREGKRQTTTVDLGPGRTLHNETHGSGTKERIYTKSGKTPGGRDYESNVTLKKGKKVHQYTRVYRDDKSPNFHEVSSRDKVKRTGVPGSSMYRDNNRLPSGKSFTKPVSKKAKK